MEETHVGRKERERLFRRKEIMDAAVKYFAEKGFSGTTLEEIAEAAEFGKGTIYNYFQNKEEIYTGIIEDVMDNNQRLIEDADKEAETFADFIKTYTGNLFDYCVANKYSFLIFVREISQINTESLNISRETIFSKYCVVSDVMMNRINAAIKSKEIRKLDPDRVKIVYNHMVFPYIHHLIICRQEEIEMKKESELILSVFFEGILNK